MAPRPSSGGSQGEPPEFCCPISDEIMEDPVLLVHTGQTFDRKSIQGWFSRGETTCPLTGAQLPSIQLTPNYALKALIQQWKERQRQAPSAAPAPAPTEGATHYPDLQGSMYPDLAEDGQPRDKVAQTRAALAKLRAAQAGSAAQREQAVYELWTLGELAADAACRAELHKQGAVPLALGFLANGNSIGCQTAVAQIIQRVAGDEGVFSAVHGAGSIAPLVSLLARQDAAKRGEVSCRLAAAGALRELAGTSSKAQAEVLFQMCAWASQQGAAQPSFVAPLATMLQNPPTSESPAAAALLARVTHERPVQEFAQFSSCAGTAIVPSLVALLQDGAAAPDARAALRALLYTPNQAAVLAELVQALPHPDHMFLGIRPAAREAAGMFLWELAAENVNLVAALSQAAGLPGALEQALRTRSLAGAGLVQLVTCEHARPSNSVVTPPNTDSIRLQLVAYDQVIPALVQLLYSDDQAAVQAAAHALANLTAFRSAAAPESRFPGLRRASSSLPRQPAGMVVDADASARLAALLACPNAAVVAPSLALLANLCADNETRDRVRDAVRDHGWEQFRQRLEQLSGWPALPDKCRAAARTALQRLLAGKLERTPAQYNFVTLLMRPPPQEAGS